MDIDFKKIIAWLKRNKINYTIEESSMYTTVKLFRDATGSVELIFNPSMFVAQSLPRCARPSHAAEGSDFYVKVGDWGKWINEFIAWAKDRGYYEYNHYHCAQWGTWKFGNFISMPFFGAFIKKIIALKNGVNESMQLDEAKQILKENGYILEDYNFYRNRYNQMNRKRQEQRELIKNELIEKIMAATVGYDEEKLKTKDIRELKKILNNL